MVDSIDQTIERVQSVGGKTAAPQDSRAQDGVVRGRREDPEGNIFAVYQRDATAMPMPEPEE